MASTPIEMFPKVFRAFLDGDSVPVEPVALPPDLAIRAEQVALAIRGAQMAGPLGLTHIHFPMWALPAFTRLLFRDNGTVRDPEDTAMLAMPVREIPLADPPSDG